MLRHFTPRVAAGALAALVLQLAAQADVRLPALFTDHMVLQQGKPITVWGWAPHGEKVTVEFGSQKVSTVSKEGNWSVRLSKLKASAEPAVLRVAGKNTLEIKDVLVGEVWVCSGQSNMEWPLNRSENPDKAINAAANPNIRLFTVPKLRAPAPVDDVKSQWVPCTPDNVRNFTAVGYFFGRDLQAALGVPVGLVHTSWGGSPAEVWMSDSTLKSNPNYQRDIVDTYYPALDRWVKGGRQGFSPWRPTELYNGMIYPLLNYGIAGAIWYQGESNAGRAWQYRQLFADMITNWRRDFRQGNFPFLCVQLAPWDRNKKRSIEEITKTPGESDWAELREAQNHVGQKLSKVGVAIITDVGDKDDIHPTKKEPVGARLALLARRIGYGQSIVHTGPTYHHTMTAQKKIAVYFKNVGKGITADGELTGFAVAGEDRKWHWAKAVIDPDRKNRVWVSCPEVPEPVAVRYGWSDYPVVNLKNSEGLPASPFRTDWWPVTTLNNR